MHIHKTTLFDFKHLGEFKSLNTNLDLDTNTVHIRPEDYEPPERNHGDSAKKNTDQEPFSKDDETLAHRINGAISILHLVAGGLQQINEIIHEMLNLSIEASNQNNDEQKILSISEEFNRLHTYIDRVCNDTEYRGHPLLDGSYSYYSLDFGFGAPSSDLVDIRLDQLDTRCRKIGLYIEKLPGYFEPMSINAPKLARESTIKLEAASNLMFERHMALSEYFSRFETILLLVQDSNKPISHEDVFTAVKAHECAVETRTKLESEHRKAKRIQAENRPQSLKE